MKTKLRMYFIIFALVFFQGKNCYLFAETSTKGEAEKLFKEAVLEIENYGKEQEIGPIPFTDWREDNEKMSLVFNKLKAVIEKYPTSKWADDASFLNAYCISPEYKNAASQLNKIIEKYPDGKFEQWTIENCSTIPAIKLVELPSWTFIDEVKSNLALLYKTPLGENKKALDLYEELIGKYKKVDDIKDNRILFLLHGFYHDAISVSIYGLGDITKAESLLNEYNALLTKYQDEMGKRIVSLKTQIRRNFELHKNVYEKGKAKTLPNP